MNKIVPWLVVGAAVTALAVFIVANTMSNTTMINGVAVPPEPPSALNDATLAGVDSNNNGVRDDVERVLAKQFGGTSDFPLAMANAQIFQIMVASPTPANRSSALTLMSRQYCATRNATRALLNFNTGDLTANTATRHQSIRAFYDILVGFGQRDLSPCANLAQAIASTSPQ